MNRNNFILRNRNIRPLQCGMGMAKSFHNLNIHKKRIAHQIGRGAPELLLSSDLGTTDLYSGRGFGVKTPNKKLLNSLQKLNIGTKKNIIIII